MASTELRAAAQQAQPEALRLADALEMSSNHGLRREAAAELRRLHAERTAADGVINDLAAKVRGLQTQRDALLEALELGYDSAKAEADQYHAAMAGYRPQRHAEMDADVQKIAAAITALKAALAEPEGGGNLPPPFPVKFDHAIGADRFKVVRGAFWWHVLIGDSPTEHGKFRSRASAEKMAADLLREFRNGAFVQHEAALAEPVQEPVAWIDDSGHPKHLSHLQSATERRLYGPLRPLYTAPPQRPAEPVQEPVAFAHINGTSDTKWHPPQRKPLTEEEIDSIWDSEKAFADIYAIARAIERAHGIDGAPEERHFCPRCGKRTNGIHTCTPPAPLTDEVIAELWHKNGGFHHHFARAIERRLKGHA